MSIYSFSQFELEIITHSSLYLEQCLLEQASMDLAQLGFVCLQEWTLHSLQSASVWLLWAKKVFLTFKWNFLYFHLCPLLLARILLGRVWLSLFTSSYRVFVHIKIAPCSLSCLRLTNTTSLSLSSCVRCSGSLIFAAVCWIHSRNQTACSTFGIVGVSCFWHLKVSEKVKSVHCHLQCHALFWPPPTLPSPDNINTAHTSSGVWVPAACHALLTEFCASEIMLWNEKSIWKILTYIAVYCWGK